MRLNNEFAKKSTSESKEIYDIESSQEISSQNSSLPNYDCKNTGIGDCDSDGGITRVFQGPLDRLGTIRPEMNNNGNQICDVQSRKKETYDREAILHELAKSRDSSVLEYVSNIERMRKASEEPPENSDQGADNDQTLGKTAEGSPPSEFERFRDALQAVPDSMLHLLMGLDRPGDCGRSSKQKPDWLDVEKLRRGQKFAADYIFSVSLANMLSLFAAFSFADGLRPLIFNGKSGTPFVGFKRMLSTGLRFRNWYTKDLWTKGSAAWKDIITVRAMHAAVSRRMNESTDEEIVSRMKISDAWFPMREILLKDFSETCDAPAIGQCPYMISRNNPSRVKGINQMDMAISQWSFVGLIVCFPESCGIHYATDEDLDDYCYFWRNVGYQLGIEDEFNFCRGTLQDTRLRSHDLLESWIKPNFRDVTTEWEHVIRCFVSGASVLVPVPCKMYETALLYLTEIIGLKMPRLYASLSYKDWIIYNVVKFAFRYVIKIPGMVTMFNFVLNKALDRAEEFTAEELAAVQIKLSNGFRNNAKANS